MATIEAGATGGTWGTASTWIGEKIPGEGDDVVLAASSGSVTIAAEAKCRSLEAVAFTKTLTLNSSTTLKIGTSTSNGGLACKFGASMTLSFGSPTTSVIAFVSTSGTTEKIWSGGKELPSIFIEGAGGIWSFEEAITTGTSALINLNKGELRLNNKAISTGWFQSEGATARTLTMGSSTWRLTKTSAEPWRVTGSNLTLNAENSTIEMVGTGASGKIFGGGSKTYHNLVIAAENVTIKGSNTFAALTLNTAGFSNSTKFEKSTKQTPSSISANGSAGSLVKLESSEAGHAWEISKSSGTIALDYLELKDSHAVGGATWYAGAHSTNISGNEGWLFETPEIPSGGFLGTVGLFGIVKGQKIARVTIAQAIGTSQSLVGLKIAIGATTQRMAVGDTLSAKKSSSGVAINTIGAVSSVTARKIAIGNVAQRTSVQVLLVARKASAGILIGVSGAAPRLAGQKLIGSRQSQTLSIRVLIGGEEAFAGALFVSIGITTALQGRKIGSGALLASLAPISTLNGAKNSTGVLAVQIGLSGELLGETLVLITSAGLVNPASRSGSVAPRSLAGLVNPTSDSGGV